MRGITVLVLPLAILSCSAPPPPAPPSASVDECPMTLTAKLEKGGGRFTLLVMTGTCPLSDGVILRFQVSRTANGLERNFLVSGKQGAGSGTIELEAQQFRMDLHVEHRATYTAVVTIPLDLQEKQHVEELRRRGVDGRSWHFVFDLRDPDWLFKAGKRLGEIAPLANSVWELVAGFETATETEKRWMEEGKRLVAEGARLRTSLGQSALREDYPAAIGDLYFMIRSLVGNFPDSSSGEDGKFTGVKDPIRGGRKSQPLGNPALVDRDDSFPWESFRRRLRESPDIAGREFCLHVIEVRRSLKGEVAGAIDAAKDHPGVAPWAERLKSTTVADLDALEAEIRGPLSQTRK